MTVIAGAMDNRPIMLGAAPLEDWSEAELVTAYRERGDGRHFEALYLRHRRRLFGLCLHYLGEPAEAEEAVHDGFVKAYEQFSSLRGDNFSAWLTRIAKNLCLNRLRARRPQAEFDESMHDSQEASPHERASGSDDRSRARAILDGMGTEQRLALELKYLKGYSYEEISRLTGEDYDQVRSNLQNGRRNFRLAWARMEGPGGS